MALYSIFYLSVFHHLEANVPLRSILVHCRLDDLIPFCKYAVIPYFAWFVWIPFTLFYLLWKAPREDFWRLCLPLFSGMTIALACYAVLPTALDLRPYWVPGSDIFARVVRFLYRTDTALTETFLRMGVDELSMNAKSILPVRKIIRSVDLSKPSEKA